MKTAYTKSIPALLGILLAIFSACCENSPEMEEGVIFPNGKVFEKLSEYNLFQQPLAALNPREGVLPYDLNASLFSDYATKQRFIFVPKGRATSYDTTHVLQLPEGSILVKNFVYTLASGGTRIVETRLLLHQRDGWNAEVYYWNKEQTEATRIVVGKAEAIDFLKDGQIINVRYEVPNKNQCGNCHAFGAKVVPIGPKIANLNKVYHYTGRAENQIERWVREGILTAPTGEHIPVWPNYSNPAEDLNLRARAYLEVNCSHCHGRTGAASNTGLYLDYYNYDSVSYGFYKTPVASGDGSGGLRYDIVPGHPDQSILYYRMNSQSVAVRMPELGRTLIDEQGVALIREWLKAME